MFYYGLVGRIRGTEKRGLITLGLLIFGGANWFSIEDY